MLKSIFIKNFQSHKRSLIRLARGVNVIVGKSQAGKTAILRALLLVLNNRPSGSRFIRHGEKSSLITVKTYEGEKVSLKVTGKGREYTVNDEKFRKFGKAIPEHVTEVLKMSDINIHSQLDSPFLVTSSGSEITKAINRITKAEKVDKWLQLINRSVNDLNRKEQLISADLVEIRNAIKELKEVDKPAAKLSEVKMIMREINKSAGNWSRLNKMIIEHEKYSRKIDKIKGIVNIEKKFNMAMSTERKCEEIREDIKLLFEFKRTTTGAETIKHTLARLEGKTAAISQLKLEIQQANDDINSLDSYIELKQGAKAYNKEVVKLKKRYMGILESSRECPTCFGEIDEEALERIGATL